MNRLKSAAIAAGFGFCAATAGTASASPILQSSSILATQADLGAVTAPFPSVGDSYCSNTEGCGTIPANGHGAFMWTAGDYVISPVFTLPSDSVVGLTANWNFLNFMGPGSGETVTIYLNGVNVGSAVLTECDFCASVFTITGTLGFQPVAPVDGGYQLELMLGVTIPNTRGAIAWQDGGTTDFSFITPEPGTGVLSITGLLALAWALRHRLAARS
jgi:hypothetical protein